MGRKTNIQRLLNKIDKIDRDIDADVMELNEAYAELGHKIWRKSLQNKECVLTIINPRNEKLK